MTEGLKRSQKIGPDSDTAAALFGLNRSDAEAPARAVSTWGPPSMILRYYFEITIHHNSCKPVHLTITPMCLSTSGEKVVKLAEVISQNMFFSLHEIISSHGFVCMLHVTQYY